jgi:hypothetical protein
MKIYYWKKVSLAAVLGAMVIAAQILLVTGCATPQVISPAIPGVLAVTNSATGAITPAVPPVAAVVTNLPNQIVLKIVTEGEAVSPLLPAPYSTALNALLALLATGAGIVATIQTRGKNKSDAVATSIIQGVESVGTEAAAVKQAVAAVSKSNGVSDAVEAAVNKVTGSQ